MILALAAEKASGGDFADFVRTLIDRYGKDQTITRGEWLELLDARAPGKGFAAAALELLDNKQADPGKALDKFIAATGIAADFKPAAA